MKTAVSAAVLLSLAALAVAPTAQAEGVSVCEPKVVGQCLLTAYTTDDGRVCFYFSLQVPTCTPSVAVSLPEVPSGAAVCTKQFGCVFTVYVTDDGRVCFYPTTAPEMCVPLD